MQRLLDSTYRDRWTRDRTVQTGKGSRGHPVPKRLVLKKVRMVQNETIFVNYLRKRQDIIRQLGDPSFLRDPEKVDDPLLVDLGAADRRGHILTYESVQSWRKLVNHEPIDPRINEFYLFHGTKPKYVELITHNDFLLKMAGASAGTLYGRGVYLTESSTKADEYAFRNAGEHATVSMPPDGLRCILLCRAMLGRVRYNCEDQPADMHGLCQSVIKGPYHSVLGDRVKVHGTYREFVVYDNNQLYPEYVLWYTREPEP